MNTKIWPNIRPSNYVIPRISLHLLDRKLSGLVIWSNRSFRRKINSSNQVSRSKLGPQTPAKPSSGQTSSTAFNGIVLVSSVRWLLRDWQWSHAASIRRWIVAGPVIRVASQCTQCAIFINRVFIPVVCLGSQNERNNSKRKVGRHVCHSALLRFGEVMCWDIYWTTGRTTPRGHATCPEMPHVDTVKLSCAPKTRGCGLTTRSAYWGGVLWGWTRFQG